MKRAPKRSKPVETPLDQYDAVALTQALEHFERSLGWEVFKNFVYYQASVHGTMSNVFVQQTGKQFEACASGAKAEALREVADQFMELLKSKVKGTEGVVESPMPEEVVEA